MALGNLQKRSVVFGILTVVLVVGAVALFFFLEYRRTHVTTDDAFVDGHIHIVASKVPGTVLALHVKDNQFVKKDDPILEIDPVDYRVALQEAQANLEMERARLTEVQSRVETARKQLLEIRAALDASRSALKAQEALAWKADADFKRAEPLIKEQIVTQEYYDQRKTNNDVAVAQVTSARENINRLEGSVESQKSLIRQMEAAVAPQQALIQHREALVEKAKLNMGYAKILAPASGYVTKRSAEVGNQIQAGQPLLAVVPLAQEQIWITANYKETELRDVKAGPEGRDQGGYLPRQDVPRPGEQHHGRHGVRVFPVSARERHRELCQDRPADPRPGQPRRGERPRAPAESGDVRCPHHLHRALRAPGAS